MNKIKVGKKIVNEIIEEMSDRSGFGNEWDSCDGIVKNEIKKAWLKIVVKNLLNKKDE